jgi:multidrug efflux pump subunit AcrA (membrane-fusion protein)
MTRAAPWLLLALGLGAAVLVVRSEIGNRARAEAARLEVERDAEAARLVDEGITTGLRATVAQLEQERDAIRKDLGGQLERAKRALRGARTTTVERTSTGPIAVDAPPSLSPLPPPCLLSAGDAVDLRVREVTLESAAGTVALVGVAEAWRVSPPPDLLLARGELHGSYLVAPVVAPATATAWPWYVHEAIGLGLGAVLVTAAVIAH